MFKIREEMQCVHETEEYTEEVFLPQELTIEGKKITALVASSVTRHRVIGTRYIPVKVVAVEFEDSHETYYDYDELKADFGEQAKIPAIAAGWMAED